LGIKFGIKLILVGKGVKKRLYSRYQRMYFEFGSQFSSVKKKKKKKKKKKPMALSHHHGASTGTVRRRVFSASCDGASHQPTVPHALKRMEGSS
jgi:hypothetical protein